MADEEILVNVRVDGAEAAEAKLARVGVASSALGNNLGKIGAGAAASSASVEALAASTTKVAASASLFSSIASAFSGGMRQAATEADGAEKAVVKTSTAIRSLSVGMRAVDVTSLSGGLRTLALSARLSGNSLDGFLRILPFLAVGIGAGLAGAFGALAVSAAKGERALIDGAAAAGTAQASYEKLKFALGTIAVNGDEAKKVFSTLTDAMKDADAAAKKLGTQRDAAGGLTTIIKSLDVTPGTIEAVKALGGGATLEAIQAYQTQIVKAGQATKALNVPLTDAQKLFAGLPLEIDPITGSLVQNVKTWEALADRVAKSGPVMERNNGVLRAVGSQTVAQQAIVEKFGEALGRKLIPFLLQGSTGIRKLAEEFPGLARSMGIGSDALRQYEQGSAAVSAAWDNLKIRLGAAFLPALGAKLQALSTVLLVNRERIAAFAESVASVVVPAIADLFAILTGQTPDSGWAITLQQVLSGIGALITGVIVPAFKLLAIGAQKVADIINNGLGTNLTVGDIALAAIIFRLVGGFGALAAAITATTTVIGIFVAALTSEFTAALIGTTALVGGLDRALLLLNANPIFRALSITIALWDRYQESVKKAAEATAAGVDPGEALTKSLNNNNKALNDFIEKTASDIFGPLKSGAANALESIKGIANEILNLGLRGKQSGTDAGGAIKGVGDNAEGAASKFGDLDDALESAGPASKTASTGLSLISDALKALAATVGGDKNPITAAIAAIPAALLAIGGGAEAANSAIGRVLNRLIDLAKATTEAFNSMVNAAQQAGQAASLVKPPPATQPQPTTDLSLEKRLEQGGAPLSTNIDDQRTQDGKEFDQIIQRIIGDIGTLNSADLSGISGALSSLKESASSLSETFSQIGQGLNLESATQQLQAFSQMLQQIKQGTASGGDGEGGGGGGGLAQSLLGLQGIDLTGVTQQLSALTEAVNSAAQAAGALQSAFSQGLQSIPSDADQATQAMNRLAEAAAKAAQAIQSAASASSGFSSGGSVGGFSGFGFAGGGPVWGPGTSTSDSILARLSRGEFVIKAAAVQHWGADFLHMINSMVNPGFALGGLVAPRQSIPAFAGGGSVRGGGRSFNLVIDGQSFSGLTAPRDVANKLVTFAIGRQAASGGKKPSWYGGGK